MAREGVKREFVGRAGRQMDDEGGQAWALFPRETLLPACLH